MSTLDVIVIGAGQAGLAIGWHLAQQQSHFLLLDAGPEIGHNWSSRWDSLTLFTPAACCGLPGVPFPGDPDAYPTKDDVVAYLQGYAAAFDLPVRLNTPVLTLRSVDDEFEVHTDTEVLRARAVVVATGPFQRPRLPGLAARLAPEVDQLHSSQYRRPQDLPDGPVLVVGGGNSGLQIAEELAATRRVDLAIGTKPLAVPQRLLGRDLFWWLTRLGFMTKSADSRLARRMQAKGELVIGTSLPGLRRAGVTIRPRVVEADGTTVRFADGEAVAASAIIWATGFHSDYGWIDIPGVLSDGRVAHRRGATDVPGLYFLGLSWQHTRGSALLGFVKPDAGWLAEELLRQRSATSPQPLG